MPFPAIELTDVDAPAFVCNVDHIVAGMIFRYRPALVCLIRVRRWFDHQWLGYSGKGRVPFDSPFLSHPGVSLDAMHLDTLTFPPFAPTRVVSEQHWQRTSQGNYEETAPAFVIHRPERRHSSAYLQRRVAAQAASALYVWFSTTDNNIDRGSVMVYTVDNKRTSCWFASLHRDVDPTKPWRLHEVKGLGRCEVRELLDHPPGVQPGAA